VCPGSGLYAEDRENITKRIVGSCVGTFTGAEKKKKTKSPKGGGRLVGPVARPIREPYKVCNAVKP